MTGARSQPVQIGVGPFSNRIWAIRKYRPIDNRGFVVIGDGKDDVTEAAIHAVGEHRQKCEAPECPCKSVFQ